MSIDRTTIVFFDAPCLIAASASPKGGSGFLTSLCRRQVIKGAVSQYVLIEAERNIASKLPTAYTAFLRLISATPFLIAGTGEHSDRTILETYINKKDVHVVISALTVDSSYLITLDQGLIAQVTLAPTIIHACTPGTFITDVLPHHSQFPNI